MNAPHPYLFTYGTLRPGSRQIMSRVLTCHARHLGPATVAGSLFDLGEFPGAVPPLHEDDSIRGDLFYLNHPRVLLELLDNYEGCGERDAPPHLFRRELAPARLADGTSYMAWVYWYGGDVAHCTQIPGGDYLALLAREELAPAGIDPGVLINLDGAI
ncbi:MAG TPA: gamma-glutamylcyclotransferase [Candidatus Sumerlaeota bacterium]|nr:gamma-glutamylcyclotransferase [Candidatus Sumerlaeota bacterium]HPK02346.1 gamma-glutamylcyclotransferase [Candidatus Sumerlaeota bacterium]